MPVVWFCGKCKYVFCGSWMTERCDCGNTRMLTYAEAYGGQTPPDDAIFPVTEMDSGVLFVHNERPLGRTVPDFPSRASNGVE
jgi:hypothetical protein